MPRERERVTLDTGAGVTKQSFKDECDINFIMSKWQRTGQIPTAMVGTIAPSYGDFSNPEDYLTASNKVLEAREAFATLPAFLRDRFANQPANLLAFMAEPGNQAEAIELGLAQAPEPAESAPDPIPEPAPPGDPA